MVDVIQTIITLILLCLASTFDIKTRHIPNTLTFGAMFVGVVFSIITAKEVIVSRLICMVVLFLAGAIGAMGLGDIKLLMAVAAFNDWKLVLGTLGIGALSMVLGYILPHPKKAIAELKDFAVRVMAMKLDAIDTSKKKYPFAPYLTIGYAVIASIQFVMELC